MIIQASRWILRVRVDLIRPMQSAGQSD